MAASGLHISISAETLFSIGGFAITNSMITSLVASGLLIAFAVAVRASWKDTDRPSGLQNFAEWIIEMLYNLVYSVVGSHKKSTKFFPFIATFFLFIMLNNWVGLLPGVGTIGIIKEESEAHASSTTPTFVSPAYAASDPEVLAGDALQADEMQRSGEEEIHLEGIEGEKTGSKEVVVPIFRAGTADINMTLALAIFSQFMAQYFGFSHIGLGYLKKFFNFSSPIMFFVGILELMGEFTKIISYAFRLFGNIFAGEVLLVVIAYLVPVVVPMPFYGLELFVGLIQALVFSMLSVVFFNMATISHDDH